MTDHSYSVRYLDAGVDHISIDTLMAADLLIVLGGPVGANDGDRYPYLDTEIDAVRARVGGGSRTLGICLGAQLVARALDAAVAPSGGSEIGYQ